MDSHKTRANTEQKSKIASEKKAIEDTKKYSIIDGSASNVMFGFGEQYVTPYALKLGATNSDIGILASVPSFIGSIFQVIGAKLTDHYANRKKVVTFFVFLQAIMLLPLFIVPYLTKSMLSLTLLFSLYLVFSNIAAPGWNSWIGSVIPENERAKYFSKRNKIAISALLISVLTAGIILTYFTKINIWIGFGILFTVAFFGKIISWYYLTKQFEPKYTVDNSEHFSFRDFIKRMPKTNFGNFVMFRSLMAFAVMIASPFFAVYMLKDLQFTYLQYTIMILFPMLIKILTMTYWGKYSNKVGTRNIMIVSAFLIALIPTAWFIIGYFLFGNANIFYIIILAEIINGFAWAGFELSTFNYVLETVSPPKRARCIAYFNVVFGTAVLIGGLLGSWLVMNLPKEYHGISVILLVFLISAIARFIVPLLFLSKLKEVKIQKNIDETKLFMDLVISKPLHSAIHQTTQIMFLTEEGIKKVKEKTGKGLNIVKKPFNPLIDGVINSLDKGLDTIEPLRKALEPERIRNNKKKDYEYLVNHKYNKYIYRASPKLKKLDRKKKK
ncbi:MAG: MFS transporter [Candidatus Woesearchaeota archaeon]